MKPYIDNLNETNIDGYDILDCLIPVPTNDHRAKRLYKYKHNVFE